MPCIDAQSALGQIQASSEPRLCVALNPAQGALRHQHWRLGSSIVALMLYGCASQPMAPTALPATALPSAATPAVLPEVIVSASEGNAVRPPPLANWADYRRRAAHLILASNPGASFTGPQPQQWQGIATVTVKLNADGSIRELELQRASRIAPHVNDLALAAVRRASTFGSVGNLPVPWQFNETFLYNDDDKFQLVTIVEGR